MKNRLLKLMMLALLAGPMVGHAGPQGPILLPTGPGEDPDSTEIGDKPPDSPKDPGNIQPEPPVLTPGGTAIAAGPVVGAAESSGPILWPTGPGDDPDSTEIGDKPPKDPDDTGGIRPASSLRA
ncbi:hypothetical protein ACLESD_16245 [Pyxidicoccus sp. 3LFB2]